MSNQAQQSTNGKARPPGRLYGPWEEELLLRYHRTGDVSARDELIERMLPLARGLARRYAGRGEPLDDLVQVASLALLEAVERFDPDRGVGLPGFAVPTILGELKRHYRNAGWGVHMPRSLQELSYKVTREVAALTAKMGRSPTVAEVAKALDTSSEQVIEAMQARASYAPLSLDAPIRTTGDPARDWETGADDKRYTLIEELGSVSHALRALPARERRMLGLRYGAEMTQKQIAEQLGISQMHVSRLLGRAIDRANAIAMARSGP